jgi:hypothetical protein
MVRLLLCGAASAEKRVSIKSLNISTSYGDFRLISDAHLNLTKAEYVADQASLWLMSMLPVQSRSPDVPWLTYNKKYY